MKQKPWESLWPQPGEAEVILETYRNVAAGLFPFVVVPETIRANEMKAERPFLWKAIMMVGCFLDGERHERLGEDLLAEISRATMVDGVSSLDVLQGLQLLLAWYVESISPTPSFMVRNTEADRYMLMQVSLLAQELKADQPFVPRSLSMS